MVRKVTHGKFREFPEFSHSCKIFLAVHFKFHWHQQCIVVIANVFHQYAK